MLWNAKRILARYVRGGRTGVARQEFRSSGVQEFRSQEYWSGDSGG